MKLVDHDSMSLAICSPSAVGYSETFIQMQMDRLPCALKVYGRPVGSLTDPGGEVVRLKSPRALLETLYWFGLRKQGWEGPQSAELGRRLDRFKISKVLANYGPTGVRLLPLCRSRSIPLVVHFHGYDAHRTGAVADHAAGYRELGKSAAAVIAVSHVMKTALIEHGIPEEKIHIVRYSAEPDRFLPGKTQSGRPLFFGVGRFTDKKAPHLTVLAFSKVLNRIPDARLVLAGDGELLEAAVNLARVLGIYGSVDFVGICKPDEVAEWMRKATAFVQHSITPSYGKMAGDSEGTPVAVLEAMMSALPVISTRHAGIGEVVEHRRTGLLVEELDVDGMAAAMVEVAENTELRNRLGAAAREEALAKYTPNDYIGSVRRVLDSVGS